MCKDAILTRPHLAACSPVITSNTVKSTDKLPPSYLSLTYFQIPLMLTPQLPPPCIPLLLLVAWSLTAWNLSVCMIVLSVLSCQ
jgi:hypothetical protein